MESQPQALCQGLLVQKQALLRAEEECLADEPLRARRRERESIRRAGLDERYVAERAMKRGASSIGPTQRL
jgi:hypothetical protein